MSPSAVYVADNPVIDQDWYAGEMSALTAKLAHAFPHIAPETVAVAIELATKRIALSARIPNFLPVLIERDVRAQLATYENAPQITLSPAPSVPVTLPSVDLRPAFPPAF